MHLGRGTVGSAEKRGGKEGKPVKEKGKKLKQLSWPSYTRPN